jgi:tetratricopeptide (TPR) repeat protein
MRRIILPSVVTFLLAFAAPALAEKTIVSLNLLNPNAALRERLSAYMITLRRAIQDNWSESAPHESSPLLYLSVNPDGSLQNVEVRQCGGLRSDDDAAMNAVSNCFPFERAPSGFIEPLKILASFKPCEVGGARQPSAMQQVRNMASNAIGAFRNNQDNYVRPLSLPIPTYTYSYSQWAPYAPSGYSNVMPSNSYPPNYSVQNVPYYPPGYTNPYGIPQGNSGWNSPNSFQGNFQNPYGSPYAGRQSPGSPYPQNNTVISTNAAYQSILKADALVKSGQADDAIEVLKRATQFDPNRNSSCIHGRLANLLCDQNRLEDALTEYRTMYRLEPHSAGAELGIASCYQKLGKLEPAMRALEKFLADHPADKQAETVSRELVFLRDADRSWCSSDPNSPDYLDCLKAKGLYGWSRDRFPLKVFFSPATGVRGYDPYYNSCLLDALNTWLEATSPSLRCVGCDTQAQADILCRWSDDRREVAGSEQGITIPMFTKSAGDAECRMENASIEIWTLDTAGRSVADPNVIKWTCMHEAGHALGLSHSPNCQDVMFFETSKNTAQCLSERDRNTISKLYASELAANQN